MKTTTLGEPIPITEEQAERMYRTLIELWCDQHGKQLVSLTITRKEETA